MRDPLPESFEPSRLASSSAPLQGSWPTSACTRIPLATSRMLSDIMVQLDCQHGPYGVQISGQIRVELELICQRCLCAMSLQIDESLNIVAVTAVNDLQQGSEMEYIELNELGEVETGPWLEDEVLLRLPAIAAHSDMKDCDSAGIKRVQQYQAGSAANKTEEVQNNPFAVLKDWKNQHE